MRYFEAHEAVYARRLKSGVSGWDDGAYDAPALRDQVERWLAAAPASTVKEGAKILELGCGTGALACMLAQRGFAVTCIDISASAIAFARGVAKDRGLPVHFDVAEACTWKDAMGGFDVVIDSHLLHCITLASERTQLLKNAAQSLGQGGAFWTETMVQGYGVGHMLAGARRMDADGRVWAKISDPAKCVDATLLDDTWWMPLRYLAPHAESLLAEFAAVGLQAIEWSVQPPATEGELADFRGRFRLA